MTPRQPAPSRDLLPSVRVVRGGEAPRSLSSHMREALEPAKPAAESVWIHVVGLWPIIAAVALGMGLVWTLAMSQSP